MRILALGTVLFALALTSPSAHAVTVNVDCASGQRIQKAINKSDHGKRLILKVTGTCTEDVAIRRDGVTMRGGGTLNGNLTILSANRVLLKKMTFTGGSTAAIIADVGAAIRIDDIDVRDYTGLGILIARGSAALIENARVVHADTATGYAAVMSSDGSSIRLRNNVIRSERATPGVALAAGRGSVLRVDEGNQITNSTGPDTDARRSQAIAVFDGSNIRIQNAGNVVTGNFDLNSQSGADLRGVTINGNVRVQGLSHFTLHNAGAKVTGDVLVDVRSVLEAYSTSGGITGALNCQRESTAAISAGVIIPTINCPLL